jgi:hypothetical protein
MYLAAKAIRSDEHPKSGNPCERLMALCSVASLLITEKIVVPTFGSLLPMRLGYFIKGKLRFKGNQGRPPAATFSIKM